MKKPSLLKSFGKAARAAWRTWLQDRTGGRPLAAPWPDISAADLSALHAVSHLTMTSVERRHALQEAVRHITRHHLPGSLVECGVWRGGSMVLAAQTLLDCGDSSRHLFLFDTFEGMPPPSDKDIDHAGTPASALLEQDHQPRQQSDLWAEAPLGQVRAHLAATGYPQEQVHFIQGRVEDTLPAQAPPQIALLRLDTDWYESTRHELAHLYPRVTSGGVVLIDDYGFWRGARQAVDEFLASCPDALFLTRIDDTGRLFIKP